MSDFLGFRPVADARQYQQNSEFVDSPSGARVTFVQFERLVQKDQISVVFVRYVLNATNETLFKPLNFSSTYLLTLMNEAENVRTYSIVDRSIPLGHNGTKFVRVLKISEIEFDTLTLKIECKNLHGYFPIAEVFLSVKSDLFVMRKNDSHLILMIGSLLTLVSFLVQWKTRLRKARATIVLLLLSIVAHNSVTDFGFPQVMPFVVAIAWRLERSLVRLAFASVVGFSPTFIGLVVVDFLCGVATDVYFVYRESTELWQFAIVPTVLIGEVFIFKKSCRRLRLSFWSVLALSLNEAWLQYVLGLSVPGNLSIMPVMIPELFVWGYAGLALDFEDPSDFEKLWPREVG
jgi:hypothetical protein